MIALICFVLTVVASPFKSNIRLEAENAVLRHQLIVLRLQLKGRARLTNHDRWFFVQLCRWFPSILPVLVIIRPAAGPASGRSSASFVNTRCAKVAVRAVPAVLWSGYMTTL